MPRIRLEYPDTTIFVHEVTVRVTDLSKASHLGFDNLVNILNDASAAFFKYTGIEMSPDEDIYVIFADLAVQYLSEAFMGDGLKIEMAVGEKTSKGFELFFKVVNTTLSRDVALAKTGIVFFNYKTRSAVAVPENFVKFFLDVQI
ncbi:MAG: thioesterase family protein [Desulfamplus sp.]|nr:thioesterase family protein [Desulfamplus sp.]